MYLIKNKKIVCEAEIINDKVISKDKDFYARAIDRIQFICVSCGKDKTKTIRRIKHPLKNNLICEVCLRKRTNLEKYGVDNPQKVKSIRKKTEKTMNEKYGGNAPICSNKIKQKIVETNLEKYGVENVFQNDKIKQKIVETNLEKYGVENPMFSKEIKKRMKKTAKINFYQNLEERVKGLVKPLFSAEEYNNSASDAKRKILKWKCNECENEFEDHLYGGRIPICKKCFPNTRSKDEIEIGDYIKDLGFEIHHTKIDKKEIDIFLPELNLGIEFNGLYWHSENNGNKNKEYHLNKILLCENKNIRLIHIFEDEWKFKKEIVKNRFKSILGIYSNRIGGRECEIKEVDPKEKNIFLEKYHIQGADKSKIKLGAFHKKTKDLIGVMTFSTPRIALGKKNKGEEEYELSRFVTISNTLTPGLASKMLTYFIRNYKPKKIYTYSDIRWNTGNLYRQLGFECFGKTVPNYWYIVYDKGFKRIHRFNFRKSRLKVLFPEIYDDNKTEWQIMQEAGYDRIWDCGNDKWVLNLTKN